VFLDARNLPDATVLDADLAVIGGGAAGITLARALAGTGIEVCVLEAGGLKYDAEAQALYEGESVGIDYPTALTRQRFLGGSSNHWGGYCRPLDPIDFEQRDWLPHSGWPFGIGELTAYYEQASGIVQVAPGRYDDVAYWEEATGGRIPAPATDRIKYQFVHFSPPTHFGERYRGDLEKGGGLRVVLNANVTRIAADEHAGAVRSLAVRTLNGLRHEVRARCYVLATGGLENPRMLLLSNDVVKAGLGNQNDLVGRFFMEHVHPHGFGETVVGELQRLPKLFYQRVWDGKRSAQIAFNPTESLLRRERLLNASFMVGLAGRYAAGQEPDAGDERARDHRNMLQAAQRFLRSEAGEDGQRTGDEVGVWLGMGGSCEQVPNPDSRVSLSTEDRDRLGLPKISLDWRLTDQDLVSFYTHLHYLAQEFGAMGIGRMRQIVPGDDWTRPVQGGSHHMGTTRMSDDPKKGVVDRHCRVHGLANLYVAGSSVFPTAGVSNPTLTIIALTLRLAEHLKEVLK
jgi:choline dehydrogenase-like flavoprotein